MFVEMQKFGTAYCDLPTMVGNVNKLLRVLTLNIDNRCKKPIPILFYVITMVAAAAYIYVFMVSATWYVVTKCIPQRDVIKATIMFSLCISSEIGNAKLIFIYFYRNSVRKIVEQTLKFDSFIIPGSRYSRNILKTMRTTKKRALGFWLLIMCNGVVYTFKPVFTPGRHFMDDIFTLYGLEPMEKSPNYEIGYTLVGASVWFLCYVPANVTVFLIVFAGYIQAQMLALAEELLHLWPDAELHYKNLDFSEFRRYDFNKERVLNDFIRRSLEDIIRKHAMNVNLLKQLEELFAGAIALEFMLLMLGLIAELLGGLQDTYLEVIYAFVQVAMDCWIGQQVMDASVAFERAVYGCRWENFDVSNMKVVLQILGNAQRTMKLSAGGVTMLSFASLMSVVKSIYSAYTTLRTAIK